MSDISDSGSFNLGLANIAQQNFGPNATASQGLTNAQTGLAQQQAQGAAIANANARMQYQLFRQGMAHLTDFSGQDGPTLGASKDDSSGVSFAPGAPAPSARSSNSSGASPADSDSVSAPSADGYDGKGRSAADEARLEAALEQRWSVDPSGTSDEKEAILQAHADAVRMKLSGNQGLAAAAEERVQMLKDQRDMNVASRKNLAQLEANDTFDKLAAVTTAPEGKAFEILENVKPETAKRLEKEFPDATPADMEEITRETSAHMGAFAHRFTNREIVTGDDGATYDKQTGLRIDGVPLRSISPERQAALREQANKLITKPDSNGQSETKTQYEWDGYSNPDLWINHAIAQIRSNNAASNAVEAVGNHAAQYGHLTPGAPPVPGGSLYRGPQPGQQPQPGAPGASPQPGAPGAGGQQPQRQDNGLLPNVNPDTLPKVQMPSVQRGVSQSPADAETAKGIATSRLEQMKASNDAYSEAQKQGTLLKAAQREAAALANNPRMVGPNSELAQGIAKLQATVTGQAPDSLVDLGSLDKILMQSGAQSVRSALAGMKIGQQEFMAMLTKGTPNTGQPLATIGKLLNYAAVQNEYDQRFNRTKIAALRTGADPLTVDSEIGARADRGDYVEGRVGVRPPLAGGGTSQGNAPAAALQYLQKNPDAATKAAFKAKYGYLP